MGTAINIVIAAGAGLLIVLAGIWALRFFTQPPPQPPPVGELRKVAITFRCHACGSEVKMTVAPTEDPDPPRHCQEEMTLVAPID